MAHPLRLIALAASASMAIAATPCLAQPAGPARTSPQAMLSDQLAIIAQSVLQGDGQVRDDQLIRARILLDLALEVNPEAADLWRLRAELARLENDAKAQLDALRQYLRRAPQDDAAQLQSIMLILAQQQTLDQRLASAAAILDGAGAAQLSPAVQSRLASFIAASLHELGREQEFANRLAQALRLDPSNIAAARIAYELAVARQASRPDLAQALIVLTRADPADAGVRRRLAEALVELGLGSAAAGQFAASVELAQAPVDESMVRDWAAGLLLAGDEAGAMQLIDDFRRAMERAAQPSKQPGPSQGPQEPVAASLPLELAMLRLAAVDAPEAADATPAAGDAFAAVFEQLQPVAEAGDADSMARLALLSFIHRRQLDAGARCLEQLRRIQPPDDPRVAVIAAWQAYRAGDRDRVRHLLSDLAARDPFGAYLVAIMGDISDPRRQSVLQGVVARDPASHVGLLAAQTLRRAGGRFVPDRAAQRIADQIDRWPGYLRAANQKVTPWLTLSLYIEPANLGYLEPIKARLTLRNRTDLPLSIGDPLNRSAIPRTVLVLASLRQTDRNAPPMPPGVVDMGRRIRIEPQSTLVVEERLDRATLGAMLAGLPSQAVRFSVAAIYDPVASPQGPPRPGMLGSMDQVNLVQVIGEPVTTENVDRWLSQLDDAGTIERYQAMARLMLIGQRLPDEGEPAELARRIADRLGGDFGRLPAQDQAWLVRFLGFDDQSRRRMASIFEAVDQSEDPLVRVMYVATHAGMPDATVVEDAMLVRHPQVLSFARAAAASLELAKREQERATPSKP